MNEAWKQASQNEALDDHNGSWSDVQHDLQMKQTQSRITTRELTYSRNCCMVAGLGLDYSLLFESSYRSQTEFEKSTRYSWRPHSLTDLTLSKAFGRSIGRSKQRDEAIGRSAGFHHSSFIKLTSIQAFKVLPLVLPTRLTQPSSVDIFRAQGCNRVNE